VQCKNCRQWVPKSSLFLHENFCLRNNIICPQGCGQVFQKRSPAFQNHWHCPHDTFTGNTALSRQKHDAIYHTPGSCSSCGLEFPSIPTLAHHKTTTCPGKLILCRFCHLQVPQEGDPTEPANAELLLSGLTPHELADGGRTTECHLCNKIVRFRDMDTHLRHHDLERLSRPAPRVCRTETILDFVVSVLALSTSPYTTQKEKHCDAASSADTCLNSLPAVGRLGVGTSTAGLGVRILDKRTNLCQRRKQSHL
jgi:hypothetical protein